MRRGGGKEEAREGRREEGRADEQEEDGGGRGRQPEGFPLFCLTSRALIKTSFIPVLEKML